MPHPTCRNYAASHAAYVPAFVCHAFIGAGRGHPLYSKDARTQFDQHDGDLYACVECEAEGYSGAEASEEFDGGEWRIIKSYPLKSEQTLSDVKCSFPVMHLTRRKNE